MQNTYYIASFNNTRTLSFKTQLTILFFTAVDHRYTENQRTVENRKPRNGSKSTNHGVQIRLLDFVELNFLRSATTGAQATMIDCSSSEHQSTWKKQ